MKSFMLRKEDVDRKWYLIDAKDAVLGRLASKIANILMGKNKIDHTFHIDSGDYVVVINASEIVLTGNKAKDKVYYKPSPRPGNLKQRTFREMMEKHPTRALELAVKRMLPKNRIGRHMFSRLKVYSGQEHSNHGQKPEQITI